MREQSKNWRDISIKWDDKRDKSLMNLRPLGMQPCRKFRGTKSEAIEQAQLAFKCYWDPNYHPALTKTLRVRPNAS